MEELEKLCRSCLQNAGSVSLFTHEENVQFAEMLLVCTSVTVVHGEQSPQQLCTLCVCRLKDAFTFRSQCQRSEARLRELINAKVEIKSEVLMDSLEWDAFDDDQYEDNLPLTSIRLQNTTSSSKHSAKGKTNKNGKEKKVKLHTKVKKKDKKGSGLNDGIKMEFDDIITKKPVRRKKSNSVIDATIPKEELKTEDGAVEEKRTDKSIEELYYGDEIIEVKKPVRKRASSKGQFICDTCGHCSSKKWDLVSHFLSHTGEKPYKCDTCGKSLSSYSSLRHHKQQHSGVKPCICDVCGRGLSSRHTLAAHRRVHTGEMPYACSTCPKVFRSRTNLALHRKIHTQDKRYACEVCGKLFYTKADMVYHMRVHTGEQPYACSLCPKRFSGRANYRTHMKIHQGKKDFHCPHCPKTFVAKFSMLSHILTHTGEKAFECVECGRRFAHRNSLAAHKAIHSKTKDYVCDICNQKFGYPGSLHVHRKKKHNIQSRRYVEPVCAVTT